MLNATKQNEYILSLYGTVMACSSTCCIGCRKEFKLKNFGFTDVHPARFVLFQVDIDSFFLSGSSTRKRIDPIKFHVIRLIKALHNKHDKSKYICLVDGSVYIIFFISFFKITLLQNISTLSGVLIFEPRLGYSDCVTIIAVYLGPLAIESSHNHIG